MATQYGTNFIKTRDPASMIDVSQWGGRVRYQFDKFAVPAEDTVLYVAKLPSNCVILPITSFFNDVTGIAGATDCDFGDDSDPDAIVDGLNMSAISQVQFITLTIFPITSQGKKLWELLGYTKDPAKLLNMRWHFKTPSEACNFTSWIYYTVD